MDNLVKRAEILNAQKNYAQAKKTIREYLQANPEDGEEIAFLGQLLYNQSRYDEGLQCALSAVKLCLDKPYPYYVLALNYTFGYKNSTEAEICIKKAIEFAPDQSLFFLAVCNNKDQQISFHCQ